MKQRFYMLSLAFVLVLIAGAFESSTVVHANDAKSKLTDVQRQQAEKQAESKKTEEEIAKVRAEVAELNDELRKLDEEVAEAEQEIRTKRVEVSETRERIEGLKEEIAELEQRIQERDELLRDRARTMYQHGGSVNYLEVILGAKSFGDFLDRVNAVTVIATQDKNIIEAHIADQMQLEEVKEAVEEELASLEENLQKLEELRASLEEKRSQKDDLVQRLEEKMSGLNEDLNEIENASEILRAQEAALKSEIAAAEQQQVQSSGSSGGGGQLHGKPAITTSGFMRPATGSITSRFGPRATFGGRMHYGIDIGKNGRSGDVPIVAAREGTVITARYMNGYGNTVMIAHQVDGRLITTLYGHMESLSVSAGARVEKGQTIGIMGNTGQSYGAHLHFEVHEGGWNGAKSNAVNPLSYIPN